MAEEQGSFAFIHADLGNFMHFYVKCPCDEGEVGGSMVDHAVLKGFFPVDQFFFFLFGVAREDSLAFSRFFGGFFDLPAIFSAIAIA
ncbi:MAG: hypothetical protein K2P51_08945 [Rhabdochlamydiaceae bacterium]|nr:hypothetical protein [Rhabdochlamydiaceae bacterium]